MITAGLAGIIAKYSRTPQDAVNAIAGMTRFDTNDRPLWKDAAPRVDDEVVTDADIQAMVRDWKRKKLAADEATGGSDQDPAPGAVDQQTGPGHRGVDKTGSINGADRTSTTPHQPDLFGNTWGTMHMDSPLFQEIRRRQVLSEDRLKQINAKNAATRDGVYPVEPVAAVNATAAEINRKHRLAYKLKD